MSGHTVRSRAGALKAAIAVAAFAATGLPATSIVASASLPVANSGARTSHVGDGLRLVGRSDLGGGGLNGEVAVVGTTAVVAAGVHISPGGLHANLYNPIPCPGTPGGPPPVSVKVVDLANPAAPRVAATIPLGIAVVALDVDALRVSTPSFTGDLAAVALAICGSPGQGGQFSERGVAYYDVSDPAGPTLLGRYFADSDNVDPAAQPCSATASSRCASDQHAVSLVQRADGRVLSLSTLPNSGNRVSGDLRLVDVTNPRLPTQVGSFPPLGKRPALASSNGCRPFNGGHGAAAYQGGNRALLAYLDEGVFNLDISDPAVPRPLGQFRYPADPAVEGGAAYVSVAEVNGRPLGLVAEEDWIGPASVLRIGSPPALSGSKPACEAMFTLYDPKNLAQLYRRPGQQVSAEIVYVGRGCPARLSGGSTVAADPLLANPAGKIALMDLAAQPALQPGVPAAGCRIEERAIAAQEAGAVGVLIGDGFRAVSLSFDGIPATVAIPVLTLHRREDFDQLLGALCPAVASGACAGGQVVTGAMVDQPGEWGGLRVLDLAGPGPPSSTAVYRTARSQLFPPPDLGVYSVHHAEVQGTRAYVAWNSDGLRVLDLTTPTPTEVGSFVPPDTADPTSIIPAKAYVVGVDTMAGYVVVTDINSGLYVLEFGAGYWTAAADGGVFAFGASDFYGSMGATKLNQPIVGLAPTPTGKGYWLVAADGGIFAFGDARFFGSTGALKLNKPIVGMTPTPSGLGYWLVASDGGIFAFGDARFLGSTGALRLNSPMVGMSPTPSGRGYWLVAADGGIFAFGDAAFVGSTGATRLNRPIVGMASTATGRGYWLVASDGGVFAFGDARFAGSTGAIRLNSPVVGLQATPTGKGYWMTAADGGIFAFGDATFLGSTGAIRLNSPVVGLGVFPR